MDLHPCQLQCFSFSLSLSCSLPLSPSLSSILFLFLSLSPHFLSLMPNPWLSHGTLSSCLRQLSQPHLSPLTTDFCSTTLRAIADISGAFLDFKELLSDNVELVNRLCELGVATPHLSSSHSKLREINDLMTWVHCFLLFMAAKVEYQEARELAAYAPPQLSYHSFCRTRITYITPGHSRRECGLLSTYGLS